MQASRYLFILILLFLNACSSSSDLSPEQQVRNTIEKMELAAQERSLSGMMDHVSDSYLDHEGKNKQEIQRYAQLHFLRNQNINIFSLIRSIEIIDGVAAVEMSVAMAGREVDLSDQANRLRADTIKFSLVFSQDADDWKLKSASWQQGW